MSRKRCPRASIPSPSSRTSRNPSRAQRGEAATATTSDVQSQAQTPAAAQPVEPQAEHHDDTQKNARHSLEEESNWPYGQAERKPSKEAWWRTLGRGRKRDTESE